MKNVFKYALLLNLSIKGNTIKTILINFCQSNTLITINAIFYFQ